MAGRPPRRARTSALVVVTHDRWFLDAVCQWTWEVHDGVVDVYEGGYAALRAGQGRALPPGAGLRGAPAEPRRARSWPGCAAAPPARTSKPKFRIDAANALIEDVPPPRDRLELQRFATQRLGKDVVDLEDVDLRRGERSAADARDLAARPRRPGRARRRQRRRQDLGAQPAGRRARAASAARCAHGRTVALQHLTQQLDDLDPAARVLATVEAIRRVTKTVDGEITATSMLERFGFTGDRLTARLGDLSGGERRRFQLLRLLLTEPNVLLLDEPTNDLDIETLNVLEDFLDGWPGTLVVVSHDRYFLERVTDSVWALLGDGQISMLPRGVEEYLERRAACTCAVPRPSPPAAGARRRSSAPRPLGSAEERAARKVLARLDSQLERVTAREAELNAAVLARRHRLRAARHDLRPAAGGAGGEGRPRAGVAGGRGGPGVGSGLPRRTGPAAGAAARPARAPGPRSGRPAAAFSACDAAG